MIEDLQQYQVNTTRESHLGVTADHVIYSSSLQRYLAVPVARSELISCES